MWYHIKRISDPAIVSDTVYNSLDTVNYTNVDVIKTTAFSLAKAGTTAKDGMIRYLDKNGIELTEIAQADIDLVTSVGKYYWHTDKTLWIIITKGAYADIATARTGLGSTKLVYQLAQEIVTPIDVDGELQCFENGTIYIEPYTKKEFTYNNGITFTYPVSAIDKIKMNVNGEFKEITNTVTLASDGLSATVADISNGTVLTVYAPIKPEYSTIPTTVIQYPTNTKSVIYGTHALANKNAVILDEHESMLLGLSLNYIDLDVRVKNLESI